MVVSQNDNALQMPGLRTLRIGLLERGVTALEWMAARRQRVRTAEHLRTGERGERAAFFHLKQIGFTVVAWRWKDGPLPGDLDLIAWEGDVLCFIEVKTRTAQDMTPAEAAVDRHKRTVLRRLARSYLRQLPQAAMPQVRFDLISVYLVPGQEELFVHFENAFGWSESRENG